MGGVNQMWILENSKDLLEYIQSSSFSSCNSIYTFTKHNNCVVNQKLENIDDISFRFVPS
jgi:hypothetical protein